MKRLLPILMLLSIAACEPQAKDGTGSSTALNEQGYKLLSQDQPTAALEIFNKAIAADDKSVRAYQGKGIALNKLNRNSEAESAYTKALAIDADNTGVKNNLAMSKILSGKYQEAIELLTPLAKSQPSNVTVQENLALATCLSGKTEDAKKLYGKNLAPAEIEDNIQFCRKYESLRKKK